MNRRPLFALSSVFACVALAGLAACGSDAPADVAEPVVAQPTVPAAPAAPAPAATPPPSGPAASGAAALIGTTVPPYPDGLSEIGGSCVPGGEGMARVCEFGLAMVGTPASDGAAMARYLIASRNTAPGADKPTWLVLDATDAPALQIGYDLQLGACALDGQDNPGLVAAVRHGQDERSADVSWARRFDTATGKLVNVETARVTCLNTAAGV